jgi:hypothetical protein
MVRRQLLDPHLDALHKLDLRDQATIVERRYSPARQEIVDKLKGTHYPLTGALLAALPTTEAITTNYDELFEIAVKARKQALVVLPYQSVSKAGSDGC